MSSRREAMHGRADRVRVPRKTQEASPSNNREAMHGRADRVRVPRKTQEAV
jgi:hypothetical protein